MVVNPADEPYASMWTVHMPDDATAPQSTYETAIYYSGMTADDREALGLIAVYAGSLEVYLWRLLRALSGGENAATYYLTKDLTTNRTTALIRAICRDSDWSDFSTQWSIEAFLASVDEAMRDRNSLLHGAVGVSGGALDPTELSVTNRKSRQHLTGRAVSEVIKRSNLRNLVESLYVLQAFAIGLWTEAVTRDGDSGVSRE